MKISSLVNKNLVCADLKGSTMDAVIAEITEAVVRVKKLKNKDEILQKLLEREKTSSTGIGDGLAIPHARLEDLEEVILFIGVSKKGVDFAATDGQPVHLIVLFLTPLADSGTHLQILSKIISILKNKMFVNNLLKAEKDETLFHMTKVEEIEKGGFYSLQEEEIYRELESSARGLADKEAAERLIEYGRNELKQVRKTSLVKRFLENFTNVLAILMWVGAALSFVVAMPQIGWAIIAVIFINAMFSFWQEFKAEKALAALRHLIPNNVRTIRNGEEKQIPAGEVVPGDIVVLEEGDNVPADARLIEAHELRVDNSVFSGESRPGYKMAEAYKNGTHLIWTEISNLVFAGTSVVSGTGRAVVIATGMSTEIGKIAYLTQTIKEELSPLQKEIVKLTKVIALIAVIMGIVFLAIGALFAKLSLIGAVIFAVGIILGNVPEGLMPTVTLALAMAVQRMAHRHALIKKLSSVETLGCTNIICTDKTGTLTTSQISVKRIWLNDKLIEVTGSDYSPQGDFMYQGKKVEPSLFKKDNFELMMQAGALCSTARLVPPDDKKKYWSVIGDPTEGALLVLAKKAGVEAEATRNRCTYRKRFPFESVRKRMSCINCIEDGSLWAFVKGAPKEVLDLSTKIILGDKITALSEEKKIAITKQMDSFAGEGLRVLAIAYREVDQNEVDQAEAGVVEKDLIFIGLTAMYDPPRPEVSGALATCKKAGIRVVMITGDYGLTALSIARQVGIVSSDKARVITGLELTEMKEEELKTALQGEVVFARVNPEHKLRVVNAFKEMGNIVAVTGDGVNDAPALKLADIGVAMGIRGTDVAKESAEMILTDDNFASIVYAIEEGRAVFSNIKKFLTYIFAHLVPETIPFILYVIFKLPVPITAMQILAIDLGTETLPALALGVEKPEEGVMDVPPRPRNKGLVDKTVLFRGYVFLGLLNSVAVLAGYFWVLYAGGWRPGMLLEPNESVFMNPLHLKATTMIFAGIVVMQIANIFACRSEKLSAFRIGFFNNKLIWIGIVFEMIFTAALIYVPWLQKIFNTTAIGWKGWGFLFVWMVIIFGVEELRKRIIKKRT